MPHKLALIIFDVLCVCALFNVDMCIIAYIKSSHHLKQHCLYRRLGLNHFIHMDYFYNVAMNFPKNKSFGGMNFQWRDRISVIFHKKNEIQTICLSLSGNNVVNNVQFLAQTGCFAS